MHVADIVQRSDTTAGRAFDWTVLGLIVLSIVILSVDTLPELSPAVRRSLHLSETIITVLFTLEYILRVATAPRRLRYVLSFYGIVDLLAILPFYLSAAGVDLYILRIVRMFRVLRILKLLRYNEALKRFGKALALAKEEIAVYSLATGMMLYLAAAGIYYFEHEAQPEAFGSIFHCLWWAVVTLTTVGYGDVYPVTAGGKAFTFVVLMCGLGIVAVPAGLVSAALSQVRRDEERARARQQPNEGK